MRIPTTHSLQLSLFTIGNPQMYSDIRTQTQGKNRKRRKHIKERNIRIIVSNHRKEADRSTCNTMVTAIGCRSSTKRRKTPKGKEGEVQDRTSTEERCKVQKRTSRPRSASQCRKILRKRSAGAYSTFVLLAKYTRKLVLSLVSKIRTTHGSWYYHS